MSDTVIEVTVDPPVVVDVAIENIVIEVATTGLQGPPGPQGPAGAAGFVFTQSAPLLQWTVNHNLGRKAIVSVVSVGGVELVAAVMHTSDNQSVIDFSTPMAGQAICI